MYDTEHCVSMDSMDSMVTVVLCHLLWSITLETRVSEGERCNEYVGDCTRINN